MGIKYFFLWNNRCNFAHSIFCSLTVLLLTFYLHFPTSLMYCGYFLSLRAVCLCCLFLFQFNVLTAFKLSLLLWRHIQKLHVLSSFSSVFVLVLAVLCTCQLRAWDALCFREQRGDQAVVLKIPLFVWSAYMWSFLWKVAVQNDLFTNWLWHYCIWLPKGKIQQL